MIKRGRPKIYYDFQSSYNKPFQEPLDLCLNHRIISLKQHKLALRLRWLFTVHFGLPTVQAYNMNKIRGRDISKYDDENILNMRAEYNNIIHTLYLQDKRAAKLFLNIVIHHQMPKLSIENENLIRNAAVTLENISKKTYNIQKNIRNTANESLYSH